MQPAQHLREMGGDLTVVAVDGYSRVDPRTVAAAIRSDTGLVSIMRANNEVGTIQPIAGTATLPERGRARTQRPAATSFCLTNFCNRTSARRAGAASDKRYAGVGKGWFRGIVLRKTG